MKRPTIGQRLIGSFGVVLVLMLLGDAIGLWQVHIMRVQADRVHRVDRQASSLLQVYGEVLKMVGGESIGANVRELIDQVDGQIRTEQKNALENMVESHRRAVLFLIACGVISILAAAVMSYLVWRGIDVPLGRLYVGAKALAAGNFRHRAEVVGDDQLAELITVFNNTSAKLEELYDELKLRESRFRSLIENASDVFVILNEQGEITFISASIERILGVEPETVAGRRLFDLAHPDDLETFHDSFHQCIQTQGKGPSLELRLPHADGTWRLLEIITDNRLGHPAVKGVVLTLRDVTETREAEKTLRDSEYKYRYLAENVTDVIWALNFQNLSISYVSQAVKRLLGFSSEEMAGASLKDILSPQSLEKVRAIIGRELSLREKEENDRIPSETAELEMLDRNLKPVWTEVSYRFMRDSDGNPTGIIGISRDVTEKKKAKEALRETEARYHRVMEASPDPIILANMGGRVRYVNPAGETVFGKPPDEPASGRTGPPDDNYTPVIHEVMKRLDQGGKFTGFETKCRDKEGKTLEIAVNAAIWPDREGNPAGAVIILHDFTEQKKIEAQLIKAQKMEAIDALAGGVAHDFNNLLQTISGSVQLMLLKKSPDDVDHEYLTTIDQAIHRASDLVKQLLTISRKWESTFEPVDLNAEIINLGKLLQRSFPKMIDLEFHLEKDLKPVNADRVQLEQVLLNLAGNARDAMPEGGKIVFETQNYLVDETFQRLHPNQPLGPCVLLRVSDTGQGMDQETMTHIFEPFFTTKGVGRGTGLGLSTVYGIVRNHKGLIACYSEPGQGTVFNLFLPALEGDGPARSMEPESPADLPGGTESILLVDDEKTIRELGQALLEEYGYRVACVASGEEALEIYAREKYRFDLVVLDLGMPGMGGRKCLREIIRLNPNAKVLVFSGYSAGEHIGEMLESGARGFIGKPFRLADLLHQVRTALDEG
ncbi:MAG: PAS domain S-box protein [Pseudomonadota bacterium]